MSMPSEKLDINQTNAEEIAADIIQRLDDMDLDRHEVENVADTKDNI